MKVYVEEKDMPKNCVNCDFGYANNFCEIDYEIDIRNFDKNQKHPNCPLQSLTDYTKQVRKEVCEEIAKQLGLMVDGQIIVTSDGSMTGDKTILSVLDQTQGEDK